MPSKIKLSYTSTVVGALSILAIFAAKDAETYRGTGSAVLLTWATKLGLVREPDPFGAVEMRSPGFFSLTDEKAIAILLWFGVYLAASAVALAIWAKYRREPSLYIGSGLICGSMALVLFHPFVGLVSLGLGAIAILNIREVARA